MSKKLLLIFTRNPELGEVKTRLAKTIGKEKALAIYKFLLDHTKKVTANLSCDKAVYYSVKVRENDLWDATIYQKKKQFGEDLGIRMKNAFQNSFAAGYEKVLIVGSDLIDLSEEIIEKGFLQLASNDVVMGPAEDGGYYLLGMKSIHPNVFENKAWGTATVREDTLYDLKDKKVHLLNELNDADIFEDIKEHPAFQHLLK
jgi:rSAM/selenodomain-associated transferase 1